MSNDLVETQLELDRDSQTQKPPIEAEAIAEISSLSSLTAGSQEDQIHSEEVAPVDTPLTADSTAIESKTSAGNLKSQVEAILYLKGSPLKLADIAQLANCQKQAAQAALLELIDDYAHRESALEVLVIDNHFALQLRDQFKPILNDILPPELGVGATRTLATIVLRGPLAQSDLVEIRGASAYQHVAELVEKGFVVKSRKSGSRSQWLRVTDKVHRYFAVDERASATLKMALAQLKTQDLGSTTDKAATDDPAESL